MVYFLKGSVGDGARNMPQDVVEVQKLLQAKGYYNGKIDGRCGEKTIAGIKKFQAKFMTNPDGVIDVNGRTWKKLNQTTPSNTAVIAAPAALVQAPVVASALANNAAPSAAISSLFLIMNEMSVCSGKQANGTLVPGWSNRANLVNRARNHQPITSVPKAAGASIGLCATYVKLGLWAVNLVDHYLNCESAKNMGGPLQQQGFVNILNNLLGGADSIPHSSIPAGAVIVYKGGQHGHIEIWSGSRFMSDYVLERGRTQKISDTPGVLLKNGREREIAGIWIKG